jgi:hypothetical protein
MATKVGITGLETLSKRVRLQVGKAIKDSGFEKELLEDVVDEIKKNGIEPSLTAKTIKRRERLATVNPTDPDLPGRQI